jgi:hypothetical protein
VFNIAGSGTVSVIGSSENSHMLFYNTAGSNDTLDGGTGNDTITFVGYRSTGGATGHGDVVSEATDNITGITTIVFTQASGGQTVFLKNAKQLDFSGDGTHQNPPYPTIT